MSAASSEVRRVRHLCPTSSDRGSSTPEIVVILPVLMLLVTFGLQLALWALASHVIADVAGQGDAALRAEDGTAAAARSVVERELELLASGLVIHPIVSVSSLSDGVSSLSVSGLVPSLIPGVRLSVSATSSGPEQQFRAAG